MTRTAERPINDFLVGLTVLVVTITLIVTVLWVRESDLGDRTRRLTVRSREVGGVALGTPVVIRGVRAGRVESITLGDRGWVVLRLGLDRAMQLPEDPVVLLAAASLFGEWQVTVTDAAGVPQDRELRRAIAEARGGRDTLAGAVLPDIAQLTTVAGRLAGDVAKVADRVQVAFDEAAAKELRESIRNVAHLSSVLAQTIDVQSVHFTQASTDVRRGVATINAAAGRLNAFARIDSATSRGELQRIVANSEQAARELVTAAAALRDVTARLDRTESQLSRTLARADSVLAKANGRDGTLGLMLSDPSLYRQSDSLLRELRSLITDVRENPRRYLTLRVF